MNDVTVSPMSESDLAAVLTFWRGIPGVGLNEGDTPAGLRLYLHRNPGLSLVARHDSQTVGAVLCGHDGRRGYLHHLAVLPERRKQGLGRLLVDRCLAALASIGILKCNIFLYADNGSGEQFWERCGWSEREDLKVLQRRTTDSPQT
jgi:ribosomal protein S18 acetylase RimI-like enzyme